MNATVLPYDLGGINFTLWQSILLIGYVGILIIFIVLSNSFVIYAVLNFPPLKIIPNFYLVSLALTDLLMAVAVMPLAVHYNIKGRWTHGLIMCKVSES